LKQAEARIGDRRSIVETVTTMIILSSIHCGRESFLSEDVMGMRKSCEGLRDKFCHITGRVSGYIIIIDACCIIATLHTRDNSGGGHM